MSAPARANRHPSIDAFGEWLTAQGLGQNTIDQRMQFADSRLRDWGTWDMPAATIARWLSRYSGWSRSTYHAHLACLYRWLTETGQLPRSPMPSIRRPPSPAPRPEPLSPEEVDRVLAGVSGHLRSWILLALLAGLRCHEVAKIRGEDVSERNIVVVGKGGKVATVPTHPDLWALAQEHPRRGYWFPSPVRPGQPYSTVQVGALIARRFREVGIDHGSIHRLRATYGTELVRGGANLRIVQTLMRHSSLATTEHYLGVNEDERAAAVALLTCRGGAT